MKVWIAILVLAVFFPCLSGCEWNDRHIVDGNGNEVFFHADSPWHVIARLMREETITLLESGRASGFNALLVALIVSDPRRFRHSQRGLLRPRGLVPGAGQRAWFHGLPGARVHRLRMQQ